MLESNALKSVKMLQNENSNNTTRNEVGWGSPPQCKNGCYNHVAVMSTWNHCQ